MLLIQLLQRVEHRGNRLAILVRRIQKVNNLTDSCVLNNDHVLGHAFKEAQNAALGIEPRVGVELFGDRLERFDDAADTEIVIALGAVKSADD
jgi:hypothetical protein